jgi:long-chain acyl-CoA synthetase
MVVHDYLMKTAQRLPAKEALVCGAIRLTYQEIAAKAKGLAAYLLSNGLEKGDRVAIYLDNGPEAVISVFGALQAGGCIVVINPSTQVERLGYVLEDSGSKFIISAAGKLPVLQDALKLCSIPPSKILTDIGPNGGSYTCFDDACVERWDVPAVRIIDMDLAAIIYTSGSTGRPKGVTMMHRNIDAAVASIVQYLEHTADDVVLGVLPLSSSYGLLQVLVTFRTGGRLVLEKGIGYPYEIIKRIKEEKVTGLAGAPTVYAIILKLDGLQPEDFTSLRYITNAAAAMPATFIPRLRRIFPRTRMYLMHGLTECLRTTYLPPDEIESRSTSVGRGMPNVELWVEDAEGRRLPPGEVGELIVRGPNVMVGYWNDPESTARALKTGRYPWEKVLRTRDYFMMDEAGYFYFVARSDELIKSRGEKVSPIEVEDVIYGLDAVLETRVVGVPDEVFGQAIKAEIVLKEGKKLTVQEVKAHCRKHLEDFKVPQQVEFVADLPKTAGGKIKRSQESVKKA